MFRAPCSAIRRRESAQVDFFEVSVELAGERRRAWLFLMRLMHSGRDFVRLYERQDQLAFLDGHVRVCYQKMSSARMSRGETLVLVMQPAQDRSTHDLALAPGR